MSGDGADTLDDAQAFCIGERYLGHEHCTCEVYPALTLSRFANTQERISRWVQRLFVALALESSTEHAFGILGR
jgi:hypothetical protein